MSDPIEQIRRDLAAIHAVLSRLSEWSMQHGAALCPGHHADTFGEGMREAKRQVAAILDCRATPGETTDR
jgi:hypothetical protein